ncbi:WD40 repeat domain containing protein [Echinococcus multilocularis]|uniref:WD40 repeat domain containing protein n=1 Tax=Echinococcus multilocularis TaxID=6211 RepID=A0A087W027_ECHMU|nr:WD40 repeat domain containing protein [Echinococcus multilocularis]
MSIRVLPCESGNSSITFIGFNQDYGCFSVGLQSGFRIYNTDPLKQLENCEFNTCEGSGVGFVEMLLRSSFLGLLGGGRQSRIPNNTAWVWDGVEQKVTLELTYGSDVRAVRLRKDLIVVVFVNAVKIYTFGSCPELLYQAETASNPQGLCHVCQNPENPIIAFPGRRVGMVTLVTSPLTASTTTAPPPHHVSAHQNQLVALTMSADGEQLATASQRGTLVRVFDTRSCDLLYELRRGSNAAFITCIAFDHATAFTTRRLAVASDHGTLHVFFLDPLEKGTSWSAGGVGGGGGSGAASSRRPPLGQDFTRQTAQAGRSASLLPRYFFSTFSHVRFSLNTKFKVICAFSPSNPNTLIVLASDGTYSKYNFTPNGVVTKEQSINFLDFYDDESDL